LAFRVGLSARSPGAFREPFHICSSSPSGEANLRAERPIVRKNMSVPKTTAVLRIPMRETSSIQRFIVFLLSKRFAQMT
jgi:hypothetical protein